MAILRNLFLLFIICFVLSSPDWAARRAWLYAIRYESLQRYPDMINTKIYSFIPDRRDGRLIFSDEQIQGMLLLRRAMPGHSEEEGGEPKGDFCSRYGEEVQSWWLISGVP